MYKPQDFHNLNLWYQPIFWDSFLIGNTKDKEVIVWDMNANYNLKSILSKDSDWFTVYRDILFVEKPEVTELYNLFEDKIKSASVVKRADGFRLYKEIFTDDNIIIECENRVKKYSIPELNLIWQVNGELSSRVQVIDGQLIYLEYSPLASKFVVSMDMESGNRVWRRNVFEDYIHLIKTNAQYIESFVTAPENSYLVIDDGSVLKLDLKTGEIEWISTGHPYLQYYKGKLISINASFHMVLDAADGKLMSKTSIEDIFKNTPMSPSANFIISEGKLFCTDVFAARLAILDAMTGECLWTHKLDVEEGTTIPFKPLLNEDKLYIVDSNGALHSFSKE